MSDFRYIIYDLPIGRKQIRFPRSKKRRIRKKWAKRPVNFKNLFIEQPLFDQATNTIICTSRQKARFDRVTDELKAHSTLNHQLLTF